MRQAKRTKDNRWHLVDDAGGLSRIVPADWSVDEGGHWPVVEFEARGFGEPITCPRCGFRWTLQEMDCVFGVARRERNDLHVLVRCAGCRLPHRLRAVGFVTAYPSLMERMEGWRDWPRRAEEFEGELEKLYGA